MVFIYLDTEDFYNNQDAEALDSGEESKVNKSVQNIMRIVQ